MFKRIIRWILPLIAFGLIALALVLSPVVAGHAVGVIVHSHNMVQHVAAPHGSTPNWFYRP